MPCNAKPLAPDKMDNDYYKINVGRHAEAAYQPKQGDTYPSISTVPTTAGASGQVVLLVTTLYNKGPFRQGGAQVVDYDGLVKYNGGTFPTPDKADAIITQHPDLVLRDGDCSSMTPFYALVSCQPNSRVTVRVVTGGTQAKAAGREAFDAAGGVLPA
jgi:hypothetical protein